jgi:kumamolisin
MRKTPFVRIHWASLVVASSGLSCSSPPSERTLDARVDAPPLAVQAVTQAPTSKCTPGTTPLSTQPLQLQVLTNSCGASQVQDFFNVVNTGTSAVKLSDISIKLWADDTSGQAVVPAVNTGGCVTGVNGNPSCSHNVVGVSAHATSFAPACGPSPTRQANWEITISTTDGTSLPPGASWSNVQAALHLANFTNFRPGTGSWFSPCLSGGAFTAATNFAVYFKGNLVFTNGINAPSCRGPAGAQPVPAFVPPTTAPVVGPLAASTTLQLTLGLPVQNLPGLQNVISQASDPTNPNYRKFVTDSDFLTSFAPSATDYSNLVSWAQSKNLQVKTFANRMGVTLTGTAAQVEQAFLVNLVQARRPDGSLFYEQDRPPSVDTCVSVQAVSGLNNFDVPTRKSTATAPGASLGPNDFRAAYLGTNTTCSSLDGTGQAIGLVELLGIDTNQITLYQQAVGLSGLPPVVINTNTSPLPANSEVEMYGDIDMAQALAPQAQVIDFEGPSIDPILLAITNTPNVDQISTSWYHTPSPFTTTLLTALAAQGKSFFDASGDFGAFEPESQAASCPGAGRFNFPPFNDVEQLPFVTLVGGTMLNVNGSPDYSGESGWSGSAGGIWSTGGTFTGVPIPSYQVGLSASNSQLSDTFLNSPDVSMPAVNMFTVSPNRQGSEIGGTSFASPLWAAFIALANEALNHGTTGFGFINPAIYQIGKNPTRYANAFNDVNDNSNNQNLCGLAYNAVPGFDLVTGWGSPRCGLVQELSCVTCGGTACVDFETDANNCGACGVSCGNGLCLDGVCRVPELLSATATPPQGIALNASNVFWTDGNDAFDIVKDGSTPAVQIGTGATQGAFPGFNGIEPAPIAVDASSVYWVDQNSIMQVPLGGGASSPFVPSIQNVGSIASDGTNVFWIETGDVFELAVSGGTPTSIAPATEPFGLTIDANNVYWTNSAVRHVMSVAKTGGATTVLATTSDSPLRIAVDNVNVYFGGALIPLQSVPKAGGAVTTLVSGSLAPASIAVDAGFVYWTEEGIGTLAAGVYRVPLAGGAFRQLVAANGFTLGGIAVDDGFVYWTEADDSPAITGRVRRLAK